MSCFLLTVSQCFFHKCSLFIMSSAEYLRWKLVLLVFKMNYWIIFFLYSSRSCAASTWGYQTTFFVRQPRLTREQTMNSFRIVCIYIDLTWQLQWFLCPYTSLCSHCIFIDIRVLMIWWPITLLPTVYVLMILYVYVYDLLHYYQPCMCTRLLPLHTIEVVDETA